MSSFPVTFADPRSVRSAYEINKSFQSFEPAKTDENNKDTKAVPSFEESLKEGIQKVNSLQIRAESAMQNMVTGDVDDISEVAAAVSEADLALRFAIQVRDKLLDAYNQLIRISV